MPTIHRRRVRGAADNHFNRVVIGHISERWNGGKRHVGGLD